MFSLIFFFFRSLINSTKQNSRERLISLFEFFLSFELVTLQLEMQNENHIRKPMQSIHLVSCIFKHKIICYARHLQDKKERMNELNKNEDLSADNPINMKNKMNRRIINSAEINPKDRHENYMMNI